MTFRESLRSCLGNYATFSGRASRSEIWWFILFYSLVLMVLIGIGMVLAFNGLEVGEQGINPAGWLFFILAGIFCLGMALPLWAVTVRRFHDYGLSGWVYLGLVLLSLIPYVGFLASLATIVICCLKGTSGPNRFGADPLGGGASVFA